MDADVKLDKQTLLLEGDSVRCSGYFKTAGPDLEVDNPGRRAYAKVTTPGNPTRRALVHDFGDKLTLNFGGDYRGGVFVVGDVRVRRQTGTIAWPMLDLSPQGGVVWTQLSDVALLEELVLLRAKIATMQGEIDKLKKKVP